MSRDVKKKAVVLLSGGLDSATVLAMALADGFDCRALTVDYHQRHRGELLASKKVAQSLGVTDHRILQLDLSAFGGSALTDANLQVPLTPGTGIPITYVPARNTIFLSLALAWAEVLQSFDIYIGVNAVDYSGYPDCRPEYIEAYGRMAQLATRAGVEGGRYTLHTPLIDKSKAEIILTGTRLGVNYGLTVSCYNLTDDLAACGLCDSCRLRRAGFEAARLPDPTRYTVARQ